MAMLGPDPTRAGLKRQIGLAVLVLLALASVLLVVGSAWAQTFPALSGRVVDAANIIPDDREAVITQKLARLEAQSGRQLVVVTLPSLEGREISDYGYRLGRSWGIGSKEKKDGALLIVAPAERKLRVEVGYGLEGILTDGLSSLIIQDQIVPKFKAGDMPGGIEAGIDALVTQLTLPEGEARIRAAKAQAPPAEASGGALINIIFFGFMFFTFFVLPMLRRTRGRAGSQPSGVGSVVLWSVLDAMASGRSSSGGGGSFGGGGGFSGGGGSFGGGGSSGSW